MGELQYNVTEQEVCTHKVERSCIKRNEKVCAPVPRVSCEVVAYPDCNNVPTVTTQRSDKTQDQSLITKECTQDSVEVLEEVKQMPVCTTVTKQQCDSKWVLKDGEKVWDGNENCRDVSWEDCTLEDGVVKEEVPTFSCKDGETITYPTPVIMSEDITSYERTCKPQGHPVCATSNKEECTNVEWEECTEEAKETCIPVTFRIPYQTFLHTLRCSISDDYPSTEPAPVPTPTVVKQTTTTAKTTKPTPAIVKQTTTAPTTPEPTAVNKDCVCKREVNRCYECEVDCQSNCSDLSIEVGRCFSKVACKNW